MASSRCGGSSILTDGSTKRDGRVLRELYNPESEFLKGKEAQFIGDEGVGVGEDQGLSNDEEEQVRNTYRI